MCVLVLSLFAQTQSIGFATGICYAGCAKVATACYSAAGFAFGTVTLGTGVPAAIIAYNKAFGACEHSCAVVTSFLS